MIKSIQYSVIHKDTEHFTRTRLSNKYTLSLLNSINYHLLRIDIPKPKHSKIKFNYLIDLDINFFFSSFQIQIRSEKKNFKKIYVQFSLTENHISLLCIHKKKTPLLSLSLSHFYKINIENFTKPKWKMNLTSFKSI